MIPCPTNLNPLLLDPGILSQCFRLPSLVRDFTRVLRSQFYTPTNQDDTLTEAEVNDLERFVDGVPLVSLLDPNASASEARSSQTIRGLSNGTTRRRARPNQDHANARLYQQNYRMRPHVLQARFIRLLARRGLSNVHTHPPPVPRT